MMTMDNMALMVVIGVSPSLSMTVIMSMDSIAIEAKMGAPVEAKTDMAGAHFPPLVPVAMEPIEVEEMNVENTSPELVMVAHHSNVSDYKPNTNESLDGVIPVDATKEASAENLGLVQGSQVGWTIYRGNIEPLSVPMIPPDSSWISSKRVLVSTFTQCWTPKPSVLPLGTSKQQPLPLDRASPTPFPCQLGASEKVTSPSESMHGRGNHYK